MTFPEISDILTSYQPISLNEMDSVTLMSRNDSKFVFKIDLLPEILSTLKDEYRVLEVNSQRINSYETLYYDTDDLQFYYAQHNGMGNRLKVRHRHYTDSSLNFFEIKLKNNKRKTIKDRIKLEDNDSEINSDASLFLEHNTGIDSEKLQPVIWVRYSRITLVNTVREERLTIDLNLNFSFQAASKSFPNLVIAELKRNDEKNNGLTKLMKSLKIYPTSFSKYCFGVIELIEHVKMNNFKHHYNTIKSKIL